ncbi:hypothetical protein SAMN05421786_11523 [Chryseobacterium ureilyticum]|uniref:Uncharacterized protein n=1 Tax=Chryseobacterium ureilyticum TaxID=373668 RepID=A0A1N7QRZ5_9FLAO|nr:hypothetical protein [Chryseobacterium ureilyticum]SIT25534.1 hypothetical protein SAMN05421786_11523 [Chryseobacterium ureilyticum]
MNILIISGRISGKTYSLEEHVQYSEEINKVSEATGYDLDHVSDMLVSVLKKINSNTEELIENFAKAILSAQSLEAEIKKAEKPAPNQTNPYNRQYQNKRKWK